MYLHTLQSELIEEQRRSDMEEEQQYYEKVCVSVFTDLSVCVVL